MPQPRSRFHLIPHIYPAGELNAALRGLMFQFSRGVIRRLVAKAAGEKEDACGFEDLLSRIGGITRICVRSTLR